MNNEERGNVSGNVCSAINIPAYMFDVVTNHLNNSRDTVRVKLD